MRVGRHRQETTVEQTLEELSSVTGDLEQQLLDMVAELNALAKDHRVALKQARRVAEETKLAAEGGDGG